MPDGGGVPADSDDDYDDDSLLVTGSRQPAPAVAASSVTSSSAAADDDIIPVGPSVDADGAPILSQLAMLPIVTPRNPSSPNIPPVVVANGSTSVASAVEVSGLSTTGATNAVGDVIDDDDVLLERHYSAEDDYVDWNFSVKFFRFIRCPPSRPATPPVQPFNGAAAAVLTGQYGSSGGQLQSLVDTTGGEQEDSRSKEPAPLPAVRGSRGGSRGGGGGAARARKPRGGAARKRAAGSSSEDSDDSPVERPSKARGEAGILGCSSAKRRFLVFCLN